MALPMRAMTPSLLSIAKSIRRAMNQQMHYGVHRYCIPNSVSPEYSILVQSLPRPKSGSSIPKPNFLVPGPRVTYLLAIGRSVPRPRPDNLPRPTLNTRPRSYHGNSTKCNSVRSRVDRSWPLALPALDPSSIIKYFLFRLFEKKSRQPPSPPTSYVPRYT